MRRFHEIRILLLYRLPIIAIKYIKIIIWSRSDVIGNRSIPYEKWILFSYRFFFRETFPLLANTLDTRCHERQTSIVPPIVETKSPITRGRTMIKSFEIGTLPFAYASADPSLPPSTCVKPTFDEPTLFFQRNKTVPRRQTRIKMRPQTCLEGNFVRDIRLIIRGKNPISILVDSSYPISIRLFLRFSGKEGAVGGISVEKGIEIFL